MPYIPLSEMEIDYIDAGSSMQMDINKNELQTAILRKFYAHFFKDRNINGIIVLPCGTGKTMTCAKCMRYCAKIHDMRLFIFVTSRQMLMSSIFYALDAIKVRFDRYRQGGVNMGSTVKELSTYEGDIDAKHISVITTTYQSLYKVYSYLSKARISIDFVFYDEAHNLCTDSSNTGINNSYCILMRIQKGMINGANHILKNTRQMFMTATPIEAGENDYNGDNVWHALIGNIDTFGEIFFIKSFRECIDLGIITTFKVVYLSPKDPIVDDAKYAKMSPHRTITYRCELYDAMLNRYMRVYGLKRIIVYFSKQSACEAYLKYSELNQNKCNMFIHTSSMHNDEMLAKFNVYTSVVYVLLSVNIFNEGVDIPCCDGILLADKCDSEVKTTQRVGRSLRKYKGKRYAVVMVPTLENFDDIPFDASHLSKYSTEHRVFDRILTERYMNCSRVFRA